MIRNIPQGSDCGVKENDTWYPALGEEDVFTRIFFLKKVDNSRLKLYTAKYKVDYSKPKRKREDEYGYK